jgi:cell division protein FtsB
MLDFHEKRKIKGFLYSRPTIIGLLVCAILLSSAVYERFTRERAMAEKRDALVEELAELQARASVLETEVSRLTSERGIESEIRDRYEVVKAGEQVVILLGDDDTSSGATQTPQQVRSETTHWYDFFWR